ncbi:MAG: hypothetical protein ACIAQF_00425 [Phycisphaerales bacterium JB065]
MIVLTVLGVVALWFAIAFVWGFGSFLFAMTTVEQNDSSPRVPAGASQTDQSMTSDQHAEPPPQIPSRNALWAINQTEKLLSGKPDDIRSLAEQAAALAIVDGEDYETALQMDMRDEELEYIWKQVRAEYDTEWVRGYMVGNSRSHYVCTLLQLYVMDRAPDLFAQTPGLYEADQWSAWLDENAIALGW